MAEVNRHHFTRENSEDILQVLPIPGDFKHNRDDCGFIQGKVINQSDNGLYIEMDRDLQPGSNVRIKMASPEENCFDEIYHIRDGRVIWCEKIDRTTFRFRIGIKILRKTIQARILSNRFS